MTMVSPHHPRQWEEAALPHETRREALDFGRGLGRLVESGQRHAELFGKRRQHVAHGDEAQVNQDLAELITALLLDFEGAVEVFALNLAALDQHLAQPHGPARLIDQNGR